MKPTAHCEHLRGTAKHCGFRFAAAPSTNHNIPEWPDVRMSYHLQVVGTSHTRSPGPAERAVSIPKLTVQITPLEPLHLHLIVAASVSYTTRTASDCAFVSLPSSLQNSFPTQFAYSDRDPSYSHVTFPFEASVRRVRLGCKMLDCGSDSCYTVATGR